MSADRSLYKKVWYFAWPAIISNSSVPLLGLVDAGVLGHLPSAEYLGGVAIAATLFSMLFWAFGFLRMGTTGLVAQAKGRGDAQSFRQWLIQSVMLAFIIGVLLLLLSSWIITFALPLFDTSQAVAEQATIYFQTRIFSAPAVLVNYALIGWLIGMHQPKGPLMILVLGNSINIVLDLLFVLEFGMGTKGAALATVIADYAALALGLWLVRGILKYEAGRFSQAMMLNIASLRKLLLLNRHLFVRTVCLIGVQAFFTAQGAQLGDNVLAANALLLNLLLLISNGLDGFAHAAEALTGEALGKDDPSAFHRVVKVTGQCSLVCGVLFVLVFAVLGSQILNLLTNIDQVVQLASHYLPWLIAMPMVAVWCFWLDGVFIGAVRTDMMQHTMLIAVLMVFLPVWYLSQSMGNHGLWLAYTVFMAARGVGLLFVYQWLSKKEGWLRETQC
ncbi:hypothetical protein ACH42_16310 [Endozoicomonas sp. (ex Bugula neritina AB1)]|nr:hypothetical protein ACH42_16310 [Endozoicomonas sp. (ex Bugula neritina AB1)]